MKLKKTFLNTLRNSRATRILCAFLALNLLVEIASPTVAMALTSGPSAPEFASFEPVATTDMVNDFTGDFTYNIPVLNVPGPDGPGYSMSLAYHSGGSSEEEASWVGYGWTLNPGAINRNKRGYPDEFNNVTITNYNKTKPSWTQNAKFDFNIEPVSKDEKPKDKGDNTDKSKTKMVTKFKLSNFPPPSKPPVPIPTNTAAPQNTTTPEEDKKDKEENFPVSVSISHTIRYNNYTGFSIGNGFSISGSGGMGSLSMNRSGAQNTLGFTVNPLAILGNTISQLAKFSKLNDLKKLGKAAEKLQKRIDKFNKFKEKVNRYSGVKLPTSYSLKSFNAPALAYSVAKNSGASWNFSASIQVNPAPLPVGFQVGLAGNMSVQAMEGEIGNNVFGYMHSVASNNPGNNKLFDYQLENESTFNKHDKNLGIPFNNADIFSATGNDVVGGFRFQHESVGSYYPNSNVSETKIRQLSIELGIGSTFQLGIDIGIGKQKTEVGGKWPKSPSYSNKEFSTNLPKLRFTNDMGGEVNYNDSYDNLLYATIKSNKELDLTNYSLNVDQNKNQSSSFIDYTVDGSNLINGIKITHKDGAKSNYGKAVYTKNEAQLSIGLSSNKDGSYLVTNPLYITNPMDNNTVVGTKSDQPYATAYLLTSNTTVNYVDVDNNGPSQNDFGGWTKFDYKQAWGGLGQWFRYRSPYNGLSYNSGKMLDVNDQTGSMSSGDKEVYYLKCIQTKSHIAFFVTNKTAASTFTANFPIGDYGFLYNNGQPISTVTANITGSGTQRNDGLDAAPINTVTNKDDASENLTAKGTHDLEKLERIVLFAKSDLSIPLTSTYFEYDYSLCQGIPNTLAAAGAPAKEKGKLTLKRVWTESNGVNRSRIAPYQFSYEYFNQYPIEIANKYPWAAGYNAMPGNDANQNPFYHPEQLDAWGNYQQDGDKRFAKMQPWLSQKTMSANTTFDPASWQLKRIQLPSGGEIHVNYEQKDYASVQDKLPMAMVSLLPDINNNNGFKSDESIYCINTDDIDVKTGSINSYSNTLHQYFVVGNNKLYFKVLYNYSGDAVPTLNSQNRQYEYVTGYTTVNKVAVIGNKILLYLGDIRSNVATNLQPSLKGKRDRTLPRYVCYQELMSNGGQNLGLNAKSYKDDDLTAQTYATGDLKGIARDKVLENTIDMFTDWVGGKVKNVPKKEACKTLNFELSYFKLPVFNAKRGGGIRVKRLLSYDPGISGQTGDATIYGSEYIYENESGSSSGVATNEPGTVREENALLVYMERKKQKFINKITNGRDTKQFEAMLGESILPSAEVVHSRVVIKNIRDGLSTSGYTVNKYYTVKDFPMEVDYSDISKKNDTYKKFSLNLPLGIFNMSLNKAWVTQGYIFKLNDMNGKIASKTNYPGIYDAAAFNNPINTSSPYTRSNPFRPIGETFFANPSLFKKATEPAYTSKTTYNYSLPGEKIASLVYDPVNDKIIKTMLNPGTEEDFTVFTSNVREKTNDFSIELDLNLNIPVALTISLGASFSLTDNLFCQHVTSKVVSKKSYLLSTTTINDGVTQTTENLAFDKYTGDPVFTRTFDGYMTPQEKIYTDGGGATKLNGYYYSLNIPASWMYPSLAPMSQNILNTNQLTTMAGNVVTYSTNTLYDILLTPTATAVDWYPNGNPLTNVVNASATTFTNSWFDASMANDYPALATPTTVVAVNKFYYPVRTYAYKDNVTDANAATTGRIYKGGIISPPFSFFSWSNPNGVNPKWYSDSKVNKYAPYGYPIEEEDVLAIKSSAKFGYDNTLPVLVAQNAAYAETIFLDFEYGSTNNLNLKTAHSGRASYDLSSNTNYAFVSNYPISSQLLQRGLSIKLWLKSSQSQNISSLFYNLKNPNPQLKAAIGGQLFEFKSIAQTGDWTLYSADIPNFNGLTAGNYNVQLSYSYASSNEEVLVDDFRMQPLDASMNCSVYYADNKLAAQFDDQHFGVFYEYNGKGQLVRKSIETERGKKTLQEQQYNTPLINR